MKEYIEREAVLAWKYGGVVDVADIKAIPAADVAPVVHSGWIKTIEENGCAEWTDFKCPVCGAVFNGNEWRFDDWKGCPVCLARLDGE